MDLKAGEKTVHIKFCEEGTDAEFAVQSKNDKEVNEISPIQRVQRALKVLYVLQNR